MLRMGLIPAGAGRLIDVARANVRVDTFSADANKPRA